ncbi:ABC transporter ATP-binding protein [Pontibacter sp. SGAir0037]|uniref:ABC transporter ATP-binding protein n=1 Tax=Pontibacter sp. SGAir0037 TaxID=2571030 RepID=UPI0010CCBC9C|nr:ABC transporter ATP-binding protein [Pontibacter sp. SGAir0037]QCR23570.1 ABC transporter ATP-binding protein [Pontibacter sp. SGAir0037]
MSFLEVNNIAVQEEGNLVLKGIHFTQHEFQKIVIAGETGSGKSTLLQTIAGLVQPSAGDVYFEGERVEGPHEKLIPGHPGIAYLSQQFELPQFLRVEQVLKYANTLTKERSDTLYEVCRIEHLLKRKTNQLSGGERQRIAMARLLISAPRLLLLDEPFSNLDAAHKSILKSVIQEIGDQLEITCLLISHDPLDTISWAEKILVLRAGEMVQQGSPEQIYRQPVNEYTAALFGNYNLIDSEQAGALTAVPGIKRNNGKRLLIRPESLKVVKEGEQVLVGKVQKVTFFGSYYELEVLLSGVSVTLKTVQQHIVKGDTIYISLAADDAWYI